MKKILLISIFTLAVSALAIKAAYITRGYFAMGGEWLLWTLPLLVKAANYDNKKEVKTNEVI